MQIILKILQIIVPVLLILAIVLQSQGTGLGAAWGGAGQSYRSKRGMEKILFIVTIVLTILFFLTSIASIL